MIKPGDWTYDGYLQDQSLLALSLGFMEVPLAVPSLSCRPLGQLVLFRCPGKLQQVLLEVLLPL